MDNHKLVMISILGFKKKKLEKDAIFVFVFFFLKNMLGKILEFGRMQQNIFFFLRMF
jgi:hypothetical protein